MKKNPVNIAIIVSLSLSILLVLLHSLYKEKNPELVILIFIFLSYSVVLSIIGFFKRKKFGTSIKVSVFLLLAPFIVLGVMFFMVINIRELSIISENKQCADQEKFLLDEKIKFKYIHDTSFGVTELTIWYSECDNNNSDTCASPFQKKQQSVYPDWHGRVDIEFSRVSDHFPQAGFYQIAILKENELLATKLIEVVQSCK